MFPRNNSIFFQPIDLEDLTADDNKENITPNTSQFISLYSDEQMVSLIAPPPPTRIETIEISDDEAEHLEWQSTASLLAPGIEVTDEYFGGLTQQEWFDQNAVFGEEEEEVIGEEDLNDLELSDDDHEQWDHIYGQDLADEVFPIDDEPLVSDDEDEVLYDANGLRDLDRMVDLALGRRIVKQPMKAIVQEGKEGSKRTRLDLPEPDHEYRREPTEKLTESELMMF
jgi:hypothetical protein